VQTRAFTKQLGQDELQMAKGICWLNVVAIIGIP